MHANRNKQLDRRGFFYRAITIVSLSLSISSSLTWAVGPPSLQISRDPQATPSTKPLADSTQKLAQQYQDDQVRIAIIIDDIGYNLKNGQLAAHLPGKITLSVLPHSPHAKILAELGTQQQKEIMLHAPMSSVLDKPLDPGGLTTNMAREDFVATLKTSLALVPHVQGVNNHMGSQLTQQRQPMVWLMEELLGRDLYFVDSYTISSSLAWETALDYGVPTSRRDIFLDNDPSYPAIAKQFGTLLSVAKKRGQAIAIAHPYPETLRFLQTALPMLGQAEVSLVPVSELLSQPKPIKTEDQIDLRRSVDRPHEVIGLINYLAK